MSGAGEEGTSPPGPPSMGSGQALSIGTDGEGEREWPIRRAGGRREAEQWAASLVRAGVQPRASATGPSTPRLRSGQASLGRSSGRMEGAEGGRLVGGGDGAGAVRAELEGRGVETDGSQGFVDGATEATHEAGHGVAGAGDEEGADAGVVGGLEGVGPGDGACVLH